MRRTASAWLSRSHVWCFPTLSKFKVLVANKATAHVSSSKITQGTTRTKHAFGSRAFYLQECISRSTDLHASVHQPRTVGSAGQHTQRLGDKHVCKLSKALPGKWDPALPSLVKQAIKDKVGGPAWRCNCCLALSGTSKVWVYLQLHSSCPHCSCDPGWHGPGWLSSHACQERRTAIHLSINSC